MVIPERVKEQDSLKYLSKNILVSAQQFDQIKVGNVSGYQEVLAPKMESIFS